MFCKKCGAKMEEEAKFCPSCGEPTGNPNYTAPKPFEKNSVDSSQNYQYQQSTFKGAQYSTGSSGQVSFGNKKKRGFFGKLIIAVIAVVVIGVVYNLLFVNNGPIYNIQTASSIDSDLMPVDIKNTFSTTTPEIFITFSTKNYDLGTVIQADWYYIDGITDTFDGYIDSSVVTIDYEVQDNVVSMTIPTSGWPIGDYEVDFFAGDDYVITVSFSVK